MMQQDSSETPTLGEEEPDRNTGEIKPPTRTEGRKPATGDHRREEEEAEGAAEKS